MGVSSATPTFDVTARPSGPRGWRKVFAIAGIVYAFFFFLTIPGWYALSVYRKWKAGEREESVGLIAWGIFGTVLVCTVLVILAFFPNPSSNTGSPADAKTDAYGYTAAFRDGFMHGCPAGTQRCGCLLSAIERQITPIQMAAARTDGSLQDKVRQIASTSGC